MNVCLIGSNPQIKKLIDSGLIPRETRRFTLDCTAGKAVVLTMEVYVSEEEFRTLLDIAVEEGKGPARLVADTVLKIKSRSRDESEDVLTL